MPDIREFFSEYLRYVKAVTSLGVPIFRYEEFCKSPAVVLASICDHTGLQYADVTRSYVKFTKVNGDSQTKSRGSVSNYIELLPRKPLAVTTIAELDRCAVMRQCNEMLGYLPAYSQERCEP